MRHPRRDDDPIWIQQSSRQLSCCTRYADVTEARFVVQLHDATRRTAGAHSPRVETHRAGNGQSCVDGRKCVWRALYMPTTQRCW
jgi:hypothetical protein